MGADVSALQRVLKSAGFYTYPTITGYFGTRTEQALVAYQSAHGLDPVGYVGPKTCTLLNGSAEALGGGSATEPTPTSPTGSSPVTSATSSSSAAPPLFLYPVFPGYGGGSGSLSSSAAGSSSPAPDTTPPTISGTPSSLTAQATSTSGASVTYATPTATDNVDGTDAVSCSPPSGSTFALGVTTVTCTATDRAGNSSHTSFSATVQDTSAPSVSISAPSNGATVAGSSVTLTATASDTIVAVGNVLFKVDGADIGSAITSSPYTTTWNSKGVGDGSHTLYAVAKSASGNYATSSETITVRNTPPVISAISSGIPSDTSATITWTTDKSATSQINYGTTTGYGSASSSAALVTSHSITLTGLTAGTTYHFQIQSTDSLVNTATSSDQTLLTPSWRGLGQAMSLAVQGFAGGSDWSNTTRSRHYSNAGFCRFRAVLPTFYPAGSNPITDTNFATNYNFQIGFEYPYTNAITGISPRIPVTFNGATSTSYTTTSGPFGYIESDVITLPTCVPAGAFFGLWTTIEVASGSGTNVIPYDYNASNYLQRYVGSTGSSSSLIAAGTALVASSIGAYGTSQTGYSGGYFTPAMLMIDSTSTVPTVAVIGNSSAYGSGEGDLGVWFLW